MSKPDLNKLLEKIRKSPVFKDIPQEQLLWLCTNSNYLKLREGDYLFRTGEPINKMVVFLKGRVAYLQEKNGHLHTLDELHTGEVTGALPYSRASTAIADAVVKEDTEALCLKEKYFREMILNHYELTEALVHIMTNRVRSFTRAKQQSEKMAALGKLSAGLAHELNNPASAVVRSAARLRKLLYTIPDSFQQLLITKPEKEVFNLLEELSKRTKSEDHEDTTSLLDRSKLVDEQAAWLEDNGLANPYEMAEILAESGIKLQNLQQLEGLQALNKEQISALLNWFSKMLSMEKLTGEIHFSAKRISELVQAVKNYAHMDRSPERQTTDLVKGIMDTLRMLNFKIRKKQIRVNTNFPDDLPQVCVYAGELNQVWTNLIDNAIDALQEEGEIDISLDYNQNQVYITIQDNGKGISSKNQDKIFDPFFTTKELGKGSGMGLEIAKNIVEDHEGSISLESEPGKTVFSISLPR